MRVHYETCFIGSTKIRCEVNSKADKDGQQTSIIKGLMCQPPEFTTVEVPIRQDQLNLNEGGSTDKVSEIELKVLRNKIGIKSITVSIENQREPYEGSLEMLSMNFMQTALKVSSEANWASPIIGEYKIADSDQHAISIDKTANTLDIANAGDAKISIPLTFNRDLRNLTDQRLYIEIEAQAVEDIEVRAVLNVSAMDHRETFLTRVEE